jgi:imidazolonepropionase-like amidohydrolase
MRKLIFLILISLFNSSLIAQNKVDILIKNVTVIPITTNEVIFNTNVGIKNDKIVFIGTSNPPRAATVIDGREKYLMPSLYDMHVHWPSTNPDRFFQLCTAAGIGTIRMMGSEPNAITYRKNNRGNLKLPKQIIGFPVRENDVITDVAKWMDSIQQQGYDFIKIFSIKTEALFTAIMAEANERQLLVCGHALKNVKASNAIIRGYRSIEHAGYFDKSISLLELDSLISLAYQHNTFICPTIDWDLMAYHAYPKDSFVNRIGNNLAYPLYKSNWDTAYAKAEEKMGGNKAKYVEFIIKQASTKIAVLKKMHQQKVPLLAGADAEEPFQTPGFTLIDELLQIQKAGLSNYELLRTATINGALFFKDEKLNGTVEIGKNASLILLSRNPLADVRNLQYVDIIIKGSRFVDCKFLTGIK